MPQNLEEIKTINLATFYKEVISYQPDLPIFIRVGDKDYPIDDIYLEGIGESPRICIESWEIVTPQTAGKKGGRPKVHESDEERIKFHNNKRKKKAD